MLVPIHYLATYYMETHMILPRILAAIMSLLDSANLRNRVYQQQERIASLELAIEDIERINARSASPNPLIQGIVENTRKP